ncbi:MAG: hypothetical protein IPJ47_05030 [Anaerolineales bacterium]|nr:hypothetical protein [Anaerolineales bacterium]
MDWYSETYYQNSPCGNPLGPENGMVRDLAAGVEQYEDYLRTSIFKATDTPGEFRECIGLMCSNGFALAECGIFLA